jgi:hypothetical protein
MCLGLTDLKYCELSKILGILIGCLDSKKFVIRMNVKYCTYGTNRIVFVYHVTDRKSLMEPLFFSSTAKAVFILIL